MIKLFTYAELKEKGDRGSCYYCPYYKRDSNCKLPIGTNCDGGYYREVEIPLPETIDPPWLLKPSVNPGLPSEPVPAEGTNEENQAANMVTPPDRYNWRGTEVLPFTFTNNLNALQYAVLKYLYRYPQKQGKIALDKAVIYLKKGIEHGARSNEIDVNVIEKYLTDNNWSWREGTCVMCLLVGSYTMCLDRIEKLIKEVYGTEKD